MSEILAWLNLNNALVVALSSVIVAVFSAATYLSYRLAKREQSAKRIAVGARILRLKADYHGTASQWRDQEGGGLPEAAPEVKRAALARVDRRIAWNRTRMEELRSIWHDAVGVSPDTLAHLHVAEVKQDDLRHLLGDAYQAIDSSDVKGFVEIKKKQLECIRAIAGALEEAYGSMPLRYRRWGLFWRRSYAHTLDRAAAESLESFPDAQLPAPEN